MRKINVLLSFLFLVSFSPLVQANAVNRTTTAATFNVAEPDLTERGLMNPTGWWWLTGVSANTLKSKINQGYRIIDLEVEQTNPYRFSASFVKNTGVHQKGWWWYYGKTSQQIKDLIKEKKSRIIDLQIYYVNGQKRYAVVMVSNTGSNQKGWWYYSQLEFSDIKTKYQQNKARLIDLDTYIKNGKRYYSAVMIPNKGVDKKSWWYYSNLSAAQLKQKLSQHKARIVDIEVRHLVGNTPKFTVILEKSAGHTWWWYYGKTLNQVKDLTAQNGARIIDIEAYRLPNNQKRFAVVMLRNSNDLTNNMRKYLKAGQSDGTYGCYLKEVKGGVKASLLAEKTFYPASTIKVLEHAHTMRAIQNGTTSLNTFIAKYDNAGQSCADSHVGHPINWEEMEDILETMMNDSDNQSTNALQEYFGNGNAAVGRNQMNISAWFLLNMSTNSKLNHKLGCGGPTNNPANSLHVKDIANLYERTATTFFNNAGTRDKFRQLMQNGKGMMSTVSQQEGAKLGLSNTIISKFINDIETAAKAGSFTSNGRKYASIGGWVSLPRKNKSDKEYAFGVFVDDAASISLSIWDARAELLRQAIYDALKTYQGARARNADQATEEPTDILDIADKAKLQQNAPNPFRDQSTISYFLPASVQQAELLVFNNLGQAIQRLPIQQRGDGQVDIDATDFQSGIYFYSLVVDGEVMPSRRMVVQ